MPDRLELSVEKNMVQAIAGAILVVFIGIVVLNVTGAKRLSRQRLII
jgi:hypothetical protein